MATITLVIWLMMGQRFEETQMHWLQPIQCTVFRDELLRERSPVRAECVPAPKAPPDRIIDRFPPCADGVCGGPLPGRRRV
jgi:hypothetical protein